MTPERISSDELRSARKYVFDGVGMDGDVEHTSTTLLGLAARLLNHIAFLDGETARAQNENTRLRAALAMSKDPCVYCQYPRDEMAKCPSGFPGCSRADDMMGCPELGASHGLHELRQEIRKIHEMFKFGDSVRALEQLDALADCFSKGEKTMTTKVTVSANGPTYPARVVHTRRKMGTDLVEPEEVANQLVASGESLDVWCGVEDTITVTEEYHAEGYPKPVNEQATEQPASAE